MTGIDRARPRPARMLAITAAWGACFVTIHWGLRDAPLLWFAALRAILAGIVLLGVACSQHRPQPQGAKAWAQICALALFNVTIAFAAMFAAASSLSAGIAAVLSNAQPLLILLPAWWLFGERPRRSAGAAAAVGFIGLAVTASRSLGTSSGAILALLAAAAITIGTLLARRLDGVDVVVVSGWHFLIGGTVLAVFAFIREGAPVIDWTPRFIASLAFLAFVGTAGAFVLWFEELGRAPLSAVALWTFLVPVFGLIFSAMFLGEFPGGREIAGIALVLGGLGGGLAWPGVEVSTRSPLLWHRAPTDPSCSSTAADVAIPPRGRYALRCSQARTACWRESARSNFVSTNTFTVSGMTCGHCVAAVREEVSKIEGVVNVDVDLASGAVVVVSDRPVDAAAVAAAVDEAGYVVVS